MKTYIPPGGAYEPLTGRVLSKKEVTKAIVKYARRYGFYARTVRAVSSLRYAAIREYCGEY